MVHLGMERSTCGRARYILKIHVQFFRYALVGIMSNAIGYGLYLAITSAGIGHKSTMTGLYVLGVLQTFIFNRSWSFGHDGHLSSAFIRYVIVYGIGYLLNLVALFWLVDVIGYPHQLVQAAMIITVAVFLFVAQRHWVFRKSDLSPVNAL